GRGARPKAYILGRQKALFGRWGGVQPAEQSVALPTRSRGEEQRVRRARVRVSLAELQGPETVDLQRSPGRRVQLTELNRLAGSARAGEIERADLAVAEVPDEERAGECAEGSRREREAQIGRASCRERVESSVEDG